MIFTDVTDGREYTQEEVDRMSDDDQLNMVDENGMWYLDAGDGWNEPNEYKHTGD